VAVSVAVFGRSFPVQADGSVEIEGRSHRLAKIRGRACLVPSP
jgi:hypothetical protein